VKKNTFEAFRKLVYDRSGISLNESKETLLSARLGKRMRQLGLDQAEAYLDYALSHEEEGEMVHLLDAVCTNYTHFFREPDHFAFFEDVLRKYLFQGQRRFRIWCAASSTGEEPYSLGLTMLQAMESTTCDAKILATDLSSKVLKIAQAGCYDKEKIQSVPPALRARYFESARQGDHPVFQVGSVLRQMVTFKGLNLSSPPFPMRGPLDMVFCRNVMIYFDNHVRQRLVQEIYRLLRPGGYIVVGHAESLSGLQTGFKSVRPSIYQK
jgi:chemotaxis protein methyltransferase CheR